MAKPKVTIYQPVDETGESQKKIEAAGAQVKTAAAAWGMGQANVRGSSELTLDADTVVGVGVANRQIQVTRKTLAGAKDLRMICKYTVGFDNVDVDAASELGILVVHSPTECNWGGVAEGTVANILTVLKKTREKDRQVKNGEWRDPALQGYFLGRRQDGYAGMTLGIIGLGRIGSRLADLFQPWRMRILAHDPYVDESKFVHHNATPVDLDTLLRESDIVTVHTNLTKETNKLIGAKELGKMKKSAILVNAARGPIVDVDALFDALDKDQIAGAALDVLPDEPPDPQLPILGLGDKVLLSPHMIANTHGGGLKQAIPWVTTAVLDVLKGQVPRHVINPEIIPEWQARFGGKSLI
jgi:D-3-phosphoglycerate dehydrogenase / 2-oxoglutarate reductase